jgi:hypothetical protein
MTIAREVLTSLLSKIIVLEDLCAELDSIGVSISRLETIPYELLDDVLDALDEPGESPDEQMSDDDETTTSARDELHEYFSINYKRKSADDMLDGLLLVRSERKRLGNAFDIRPYLFE